jgi:DNA-binding SARP family transcriptional activator
MYECVPERKVQATLHATCFGRFRLGAETGSGRGPQQKRAREVMQYLVLHPRGVAARERLTEILWPDDSSSAVVHRLHAAISGARTYLRRLFGGFNAITRTDEGYAWDPGVRIECDVGTFEALYRDGSGPAIRKAVALYSGELLAGQDTDWVRPVRVRYAAMYGSMVERLAIEAIDARDYQQALHFALQLLEIDRAHEGASRLVLRCFGALGQRAQALSEYTSLRAYLLKNLGAQPMPETTQLIDAIMRRGSAAG